MKKNHTEEFQLQIDIKISETKFVQEQRMFKKHLVLMIVSVLFSTAVHAVSEITPELTKECARAGGKAKIFSSGCTDTCDIFRKRKIEGPQRGCTMALKAACDCGPEKCMEANLCVPNPK